MKKYRWYAAALAGLAMALSLAGCPSDDAALPDGFVRLSPTEPMTPAERIAALSRITDELQSIMPPASTPWQERDLAAEIRNAGEKLVALPEVAAVFTYEETLSATIVMSDGFAVAFFNSRPPGQDSASLARLADAPRSPEGAGSPPILPTSQPGSKKAVAVSFDGGAEVAAEITDRLSASGYDVLPLTPSLADMRNYKDLGFLYLDTHGGNFSPLTVALDDSGKVTGYGPRLDANGDRRTGLYIIQTSTIASVDSLVALVPDIDNGDVLFSISQNKDGAFQAAYGVTESFVEKHWTFDEGIVILHVCFGASAPFNKDEGCFGNCPSGTETLDPKPAREAVLAAGANALMTFSAGTWPSAAAPSMYYFIDRLLGANVEAPTSPPNRPFDWVKVRDAMTSKGLMEFENGKTNQILLEGNETYPAALAPSIDQVEILESASSQAIMTLHGAFGDNEGTVTFDGAALAISTWSQDSIIGTAPGGHTRHGPVIVRAPSGIESNAVPLTHWQGEFEYTHTDGDLVRIFHANLSFRGDSHTARAVVDGSASELTTVAYLTSIGVDATLSAQGTATLGGGQEIRYEGGDALTVYGKDQIDILTSGERVTPAFSGTSEFAGAIEFVPGENVAKLCLWMTGYHDIYQDDVLEPHADSYFSLEAASVVIPSAWGELDCFHMKLNDDGSIDDGSLSNGAGANTLLFEWKNFVTSSPPNANTPG